MHVMEKTVEKQVFRPAVQNIYQEPQREGRERKTMIFRIESAAEKQQIASRVLHALPDWFSLPESTKAYIEEVAALPFWASMEDGKALGFIALKETSPYTAEICVMGVLPQHHRQGIGRALFAALHAYAQAHGYEYLQVKTVQEGHYAEYDRTNAFYRGLGFRELECFPTLWEEGNPCQLFVMAVAPRSGSAH